MFAVRALQTVLLALMTGLVFGLFVGLALVQAVAGWFANLSFDPFGRYATAKPAPAPVTS